LAVAHDAVGGGEEEEGLWFAVADWGAVWLVVLLFFSVFSFCFISFFSFCFSFFGLLVLCSSTVFLLPSSLFLILSKCSPFCLFVFFSKSFSLQNPSIFLL
jgi:hypothetical protein